MLPEGRRSLPRGALSSRSAAPSVLRELAGVLNLLRARASESTAFEPLLAEATRRRESAAEDGFETHHAIEAIDGGSRVTRAEGVSCRLRDDGDGVVVELSGGHVIRAPSAAKPALRYVLGSDTFTVGSLPDVLSESSKVVLVRRLMREGVLKPAAPGRRSSSKLRVSSLAGLA